MEEGFTVYCGIDVGKGELHAVGLDAAGRRLYDKALPNNEAKLRAVFQQLATRGPILIVVDQPNTIGALPVSVAWTGVTNARCKIRNRKRLRGCAIRIHEPMECPAV
ncbi:hypothetical protein ACNUDN_00089 [Mycobacterium sp. smrl_JER01]